MIWLPHLSIRRKLTLVSLITSTTVLLLACAALMVDEILTFRTDSARDLAVLADVLAQNTTAALAFQDEGEAKKTLMALQAESRLVAARLYDKAGRPFVDYTRAGAPAAFPEQPGRDGHQFERDRLVLFRPVLLNNKRIGTIYLHLDLEGLYGRLKLFSAVVGLVLVGAVLVAVAMSSRLHRPIFDPILALAQTARSIAERKDYSVRAQKQSHDETGLLTDAFNQMLTSIEERDRSLRKLSRVVEQGADAVLITDPEGVIEYVNPAFEAMTGYPAGEAVGRKPNILKSGRHEPQLYQELWATILAGETYHGVLTNQKKNGELYYEQKSITPLKDPQGRILHFVSTGHDITQRIRAEEQLRALNETLEQRVAERTAAAETANRAKSEFLANMSHELRTPLNSVIGFANILLKNKATTLRREDLLFLERIVANGKHLLGLINQILDLSKIEARKVELEYSTVSLSALIPDVLAQFEGQLRGRDVKLLADLPPAMAPIVTDEVKLKQVLINLVANALKFTEHGSVTVRVMVDPKLGFPLRIAVVDTGIGIPRNRMAAVFEAFQQADASTTRKYGGTGLGLTISQALCLMMGYRIEVQSEVGQGSTFSVVLDARTGLAPSAADLPAPAEARPVPARAPRTAGRSTSLQDRLVLVIDDESDARMLLTNILEEFGCRVLAAGSGADGLRMAREFRPELITVDLLMPHMNGWDVLKAIKSDELLRDIPVVVVSIVAGENRGRILGAVEILQKPLVREDLLAVLQRTFLPEKKLLVVDDDEDARRIISAYLADHEFHIRTAVNGREALDLLATFAPDAILLDLLMPVVDGVTFLETLRAIPRFRHLPVIIITAKIMTAEEVQHLTAQVESVLKKSEDLEADLKQVLEDLLHHPRVTAPVRADAAPAPLTTGGATHE